MNELIPCGKNEEGEEEFIGTKEEWQKAENLAEETDREEDLEQENLNGYFDEGRMRQDEIEDQEQKWGEERVDED